VAILKKSVSVMVMTATALLAVMIFASVAGAVAAKFHSATGSVDNSGALVVNFDERGLGNGNIDYTLDADATATYACINGGGKHPQAANKETVNGEVTAAGSFESKNGRVLPEWPAVGTRCGLLQQYRPHGHDQRDQYFGS
jgi:hypothetical protein